MIKWEYKFITFKDSPYYNYHNLLDGYGNEGWELITLVSNPGWPDYFIFKRVKH